MLKNKNIAVKVYWSKRYSILLTVLAVLGVARSQGFTSYIDPVNWVVDKFREFHGFFFNILDFLLSNTSWNVNSIERDIIAFWTIFIPSLLYQLSLSEADTYNISRTYLKDREIKIKTLINKTASDIKNVSYLGKKYEALLELQTNTLQELERVKRLKDLYSDAESKRFRIGFQHILIGTFVLFQLNRLAFRTDLETLDLWLSFVLPVFIGAYIIATARPVVEVIDAQYNTFQHAGMFLKEVFFVFLIVGGILLTNVFSFV